MAKIRRKGATGRPTAVLRMSGIPLVDDNPGVPIAVAADGTEYELVDIDGLECAIDLPPSGRPAWVRMSVDSNYAHPAPPRRKPSKKKRKRATKASPQ